MFPGLILGGLTMMQLGGFKFGLQTAAYQQLRRTTEYSWPTIERFGQHDAMQFTGYKPETITLTGVIVPEFRGGTGQIERLRDMANAGLPQMLVSGNGDIMGRWIIERIEETQSVFAAGGTPRMQEFSLSLRKYDDGQQAAV